MKNTIGLAISLIAIVAVMTSLTAIQAQAKKLHNDDNDKPTGSNAMERGAHDATHCEVDDCHLYITQPGKGFADHSEKFNKNYIKGFCAAGAGGSDADQATFDCDRDNN